MAVPMAAAAQREWRSLVTLGTAEQEAAAEMEGAVLAVTKQHSSRPQLRGTEGGGAGLAGMAKQDL